MSELCPQNCAGRTLLASLESSTSVENAITQVTGLGSDSVLQISTRERCGGMVINSVTILGENGPANLSAPLIVEISMGLRSMQTALNAARRRVANCPGVVYGGCQFEPQSQEGDGFGAQEVA